MTSLPNEQEECQSEIHWRAVPSLREIWTEERQRMKVLLSAKDNFLSNTSESGKYIPNSKQSKDVVSQNPPPFTLSVKKGATVPGARLACRGMKKLYQSSPGVETDFRRAMNDIVCRHEILIDQIDARLYEKYTNENIINKQIESKPRQFTPQCVLKFQNSSPKIAEDEALLALQALARQFSFDLTPDKHMYTPEPSQHTFEENEVISQSIKKKFGIKFGSPPLMLSSCSQFYSQLSCVPPMTQEVLEEVEDALDFCRGVDNGDVTTLLSEFKAEGNSQSNIKCINPLTLTPYELLDEDEGFLDEEDNMGEDALERSLSILATQSTIRSHENNNDSEASLIPGIQTYKFDDVNDFQIPHSQASLSIDSPKLLRHTVLSPHARNDSNILEGKWSKDVKQGAPESSGVVHVQSQSLPTSLCNSINDLAEKSPKPQLRSMFSVDSISPCDRMDYLFELKECPPLRNAFENGGKKVMCSSPIFLHPATSNSKSTDATPYHRFSHLSYQSKETFAVLKVGSCKYIEPVVQPPSVSRIRRWLHTERLVKRRETIKGQQVGTHKKRNKSDSNLKSTKIDMHANVNSKIVQRAGSKKRKEVVSGDNINISTSSVYEVEEIEWEKFGSQSQDSVESPSLHQSVDEIKQVLHVEKPVKSLDTTKSQDSVGLNINSSGVTQTMASHSLGLQTFSGNSNSADNPSQETTTQGERACIERIGGLKVSISQTNCKPLTQLTIMSIEVHVQCRTGKAGINDSKEIAMKPDPSKDAVSAVTYVYACDPGGGEKIRIIDCGCIFVPSENELSSSNTGDSINVGKISLNIISQVGKTLGISCDMKTEVVSDEIQLLLRLASVVQWKDPDALISWYEEL